MSSLASWDGVSHAAGASELGQPRPLESLPLTKARAGTRLGRRSITLALPFGSTPLDSEAGREFLRERLALFSKVVFLLSAFAFVAIQLLELGIPGRDVLTQFREHGRLWHVIAALVSLAVWQIARRTTLSLRRLFGIDVSGTLLALSAYALMALEGAQHAPQRIDLVMMLVTICMVTLRAIIIPSTPGHTLLVGGIGAIPGLALSYYVAATYSFGNVQMPAFVTTGYIGVWTVLALSISGLASQVIYGLRKQVARAEQLGQYVLDEKIGEGGMGVVYRARHALLRRPTAIKLVLPERAGAHTLLRFEREVQLTAMLTHPNTVSIYDYGHTPEGIFYYAMEYLDGIDLEELVERFGPQPPERVVHILEQVVGSLAEAHAIGLVHRDIKPANVILCDRAGVPDLAKVVDFGLVKDVSTLGRGRPTLSSANAIIGTPLYLAPEAIVSPELVDERTDVYALGAVAYFLLCARPVFSGASVVEVCAQHVHTKPIPPSSRLGRAIPKDLETLVLRCLAKKKEERPATAEALLELLKRLDTKPWSTGAAREWWSEHAVRARARPARAKATRGVHDTIVVDLTTRSHAAP